MRLLWVDVLKILAIFGVVLLHASAPFLVPFEDSAAWWTGNIYDSFVRWCVPLFVMVSGALVLPGADKVPLREFLLVRIRRILIPFLVWSAVYFFYGIQVKGDEYGIGDFFPLLFSEPIYYHLWFIYMLVTLYLFAPVISALLNQAPRKFAWYLVGLWFCWASVLPIIHELFDYETYFVSDLNEYSALKLSGYFLLGYLLKDVTVQSKSRLFLPALVFLAGGAATSVGTYLASRQAGEFVHFFYDYFSITVVAMAIPLFFIVRSVFDTRRVITENGNERIRMNSPKLLQRIGKSVFGIYLIHALILELLRDGRLGFTIDHGSAFGMTLPLAVGIPFFALSIFVLSLSLVFIFSLVPFMRKIIA
ncbi:Surface polysaccharide O-acyltransferase, integral membrane enzyme [Desulfonatronum thiosulfatophilum]|uniref:Surface polysaccharide O-acyltransferase, integral membrane enzyme n=1 Tax=Desulfonatronum thiosulfatophilum TaxID=617002 RepID=A0A1G6ETS1_9BACT|nr:acyltransferase family protein [Desulfonatronum thiosulfatophilum]SDB60763.1 Surface polysaccharide O-acyltransferase, integral membrane enzyme [Desulfonatronum thiosulfatophilum]